jgi:hypothetical protein
VSPVRYELGFYIPEDAILHSHCREHLKSYTCQCGLKGQEGPTAADSFSQRVAMLLDKGVLLVRVEENAAVKSVQQPATLHPERSGTTRNANNGRHKPPAPAALAGFVGLRSGQKGQMFHLPGLELQPVSYPGREHSLPPCYREQALCFIDIHRTVIVFARVTAVGLGFDSRVYHCISQLTQPFQPRFGP